MYQIQDNIAGRLVCTLGIMFMTVVLGGFAHAQAQDEEPPSDHPFAEETGWIAYSTFRDGSSGTWLIRPDGTEDHEIAQDFEGYFLLPDWSPDGQRIVMTIRGGDTEPLYEYDLESGELRQLFECNFPVCLGDDEPAYSPDGTRVAFIRYLGTTFPTDCSLWIGDLETLVTTQITSNPDFRCDREYNPRWSPDGTKITYWRWFEEDERSQTAIFTINVDGTGGQQLTDLEMVAGDPDWSPDGEWIVFSTYPLFAFNHEPAVSNLYRMRPDGSEIEQLTFNETTDLRATQPRYTPDGDWIIFTAVTPSTRSLWAIPADGGEPVVIAQGGIYTRGTWQP